MEQFRGLTHTALEDKLVTDQRSHYTKQFSFRKKKHPKTKAIRSHFATAGVAAQMRFPERPSG